MNLLARVSGPLRATWAASAATMIVLVTTFVILGWQSHRAAERDAQVQLRDGAEALAAHLRRVTEVADILLLYQQDLALSVDPGDSAALEDVNRRLQQLVGTVPYVFRLFMIDERGDVYASSMKEWGPLNTLNRGYFRFHRSGGKDLHISSVLHSQATGDPIVIFSRRIADRDGAFRGVALVSFQLEEQRWFAQRLLPRGRTMNFQVIGPHAQIIVDGTAPPDQTGAFLSQNTQALFRSGSSGLWTYTATGDVERIWAHERVGQHPLWVRVGTPTRELFILWFWEALPYALAALLTLAVLTGLFVLGLRQARTVESARRELQEVNRDLERRVEERTSDLESANAALMRSVKTLETLQSVTTKLASELKLQDIVQAATDAGVALTGAEFGAFFYNVRNESGESYRLYALSGVPAEKFANMPMPRNTAIFGTTFNGKPLRLDDVTKDPRYGKNAPYHVMPEGHLPVRSYLAVPVISRSGEVLGGLFFGHASSGVFAEAEEELARATAAQAAIAIDNAHLFETAEREISEHKQTETRLRLVAREVDHRAKNMLAIVQSMVHLTRAGTVGQLKRELNGRIQALGRAHSLLAENRWQGAALRLLIEEELAPFQPDEGRTAILGADVVLVPSAAQTMAMVLHELATNAAKYGALSVPGGRIAVEWEFDNGRGLTLQWSETGGPPVQRPEHQGFGLRLISQSISYQLRGDVALAWRPEGLLCTVQIPASAIHGQQDAEGIDV